MPRLGPYHGPWPASPAHGTPDKVITDQARTDIEEVLELYEAEPTEPFQWAILGYVYGYRHAGQLSRAEFIGYLDRLGISGPDEAAAGVIL